ncbi:MAG: hypothetical protein U0T69_10835 [Chitinophagales bacterium]
MYSSMYKRNLPFQSLFIVLILCVLFTSCKRDKDGDDVLDENDKCDTVYAKTEDGCPCEKEEKLGKINIFLDNSASNNGYYKSTLYGKNLSELLNLSNDSLGNPYVFTIDDNGILPKGNGQEYCLTFMEQLGSIVPFAEGESSTLYTMLKSIVDKTDSNDISIFVTDCILSNKPDALKGNPDKNKLDAQNCLYTTYIRTAFPKYKEIGTSFYAFKSDFKGKYYDYTNKGWGNKNTLLNNRPYYFIVLSKNKKILKEYNYKIENSVLKTEILEKFHFGDFDNINKKATILFSLNSSGNFEPDENLKGINNIEDLDDGPVKVYIGVENLNENEIDFSDTSLLILKSVNRTKFNAKFVKYDDLKSFQPKLTKQDNLIFNKCNYFIEVEILESNTDKDILSIKIPFKYKKWEEKWSIDDDLNAKNIEDHTFGLRCFIDAYKQAFPEKGKNIIDINIPITINN